ncbi:choice-of-anchor L domain-containing protein [Formosa sp. PL04]|uniref:T9SS type B sorting domain-containing protein n=1 Tax=Formosa sp. PL04 TaxID=3081755 RepID=UPI00298152A9|nr:choice-of-anchor L domain-containing protein [Formosa sp. PL04]MDW5288820.1 choice-of-anchor L domain-containing protein [Formosa sp. PL04]
MKLLFYTSLIFVLLCNGLVAQTNADLISVTPSSDPLTLIENNFLSGNGIIICDPKSPKNASASGESFYSLGSFDKASSNFPFEQGIVLTTGNVIEGGNDTTTDPNGLNSGSNSWLGDPDLETALGISNTRNATVLEFDFVAITTTIAFDYVLASDEYRSPNICNNADGFAILIQEEGSTTFQNIAIIPNTNTPVSTKTINGNSCSDTNIQYYENEVSKLESTNFYGRTKVLTAKAEIKPYKKYKIKIIVADQGDTNLDTAVFIKKSDVNVSLNLGNDITTCTDTELTPKLQSDFGVDTEELNISSYTWYNNTGDVVSTNPTYQTSDSGNYTLDVQIYKPDCINGSSPTNIFTISDEISITVLTSTPIPLNPASDFSRCSINDEIFILTNFDNYIIDQIKSTVPGNAYTIEYINSFGKDITETTVAPGERETINVEVTSTQFKCVVTLEFDLIVNIQPDPQPIQNYPRCDNDLSYNLENLNSLFVTGDLNDFTITYHYTEYQAEQGTKPITGPYLDETSSLYVRVEDKNTGCIGTTTLTLEDIESPKLNNSSSSVIAGCTPTTGGGITLEQLEDARDDVLNGLDQSLFNITYFKNATDAENNVNKLTGTDLAAYLDNAPSILFVRVEPIDGGCPSIAQIDIYPNILLAFQGQIQNYAICGGDTFNLEKIANDIVNGDNAANITFFEDSTLSTEINKIANYEIPNSGLSQTIYIEITYPGCGGFDSKFDIFKAPELEYVEPYIPHCSSERVIDLYAYNDLIDTNNSGYKIQYYLSETDRDLDTNKLPQYIDYTDIIGSSLYARVIQEKVTNGTLIGECYDSIEFTVEIIYMPQVYLDYTDFQYCITNSEKEITLDQVVIELKDLITNNTINSHIDPDDIDIKLYEVEDDAIAGNSNFITDPSTYTTVSTIFYSRVTNKINTSFCPVIDPINIEVFLEPEFSKSEFFACDSPDFRIGDIDKSQLLVYDLPEIEVIFYDSKDGTILSNNTIIDVSSGAKTIYAEAKNTNNSKCNIPGITITLDTAITPEEKIVDVPICVITGQSETEIDLVATALAIDDGRGLNITFYKSESNANNRVDLIPNTVSYKIPTTPTRQNIYVRIENQNTSDCFKVQPLLIQINDIPDFSSAIIAASCSTNYTGENVTFNLSESIRVINVKIGFNAPDIYYFEDENDANSLNISEQITDIENYINPIGNQVIYIVAQDPDTKCYEIQPLELIVNYPPDTKELNEFIFCEDGTETLNLTEIDNRLVYDLDAVTITYYSTTAEANTGTNPLDNIYDYITNGVIIFARVQSNDTGCNIVKQLILVPIINPNGTTLNVTTTSTFLSSSNAITVSVTGGSGDYLYSLDNGEYQSSNIFNNVTIGQHTVFVKDKGGCAEGFADEIVIDIPKFFTPNQDSFHDTWHIIGIEELEDAEVSIFDRQGKLLKIITQDTTGWDGLYNGSPMPTDDYWYVAKINQDNRYYERTGHFTLKR